MKIAAIFIAFFVGFIECARYIPLSKEANTNFINMEGGGMNPGYGQRLPPGPPIPGPGTPTSNVAPARNLPQGPGLKPAIPQSPVPLVTTLKPFTTQKPYVAPVVLPGPVKPIQPIVTTLPPQLRPNPSRPITFAPGQISATTPGYNNNVRQLIGFYDRQGQAGLVKPATYNQATKQG